MSARAAWAGVIVSDVEASAAWYAQALGARVPDRDERWAKLTFPNGTTIELFTGDRSDPGASFPSYGADPGPPVMPGYAIEDPEALVEAHGLEVARFLPGWLVVVAPDRLRMVLLSADPRRGQGLVGFRFSTISRADQERFLDQVDVAGPEMVDGEVGVTPVFRGRRSVELQDPDGTRIVVVR